MYGYGYSMYLRRFFGDGIDPDAEAFIIAAGINKPIQEAAINNLVIGLKADGLWNKMKAIYPFVGGTATAHKFNLKDPRDLDAAFRLVFFGGWTHDINGSQPNGTNAYADTNFNALNNFNASSRHLSFYNRTDTAKGYDMGCYSGFNDTMLASRFTASTSAYTCFGSISGGYTTATTPTALGFIQSNNISSSEKIYKNGSSIVSSTRAITNVNLQIFIGAGNFDLLAAAYTDHQCAFASIGDGLNDTEAANLNTRVQAFQTALSRQV
jgi:hypothetical protein